MDRKSLTFLFPPQPREPGLAAWPQTPDRATLPVLDLSGAGGGGGPWLPLPEGVGLWLGLQNLSLIRDFVCGHLECSSPLYGAYTHPGRDPGAVPLPSGSHLAACVPRLWLSCSLSPRALAGLQSVFQSTRQDLLPKNGQMSFSFCLMKAGPLWSFKVNPNPCSLMRPEKVLQVL